jgi:hypothetical protein
MDHLHSATITQIALSRLIAPKPRNLPIGKASLKINTLVRDRQKIAKVKGQRAMRAKSAGARQKLALQYPMSGRSEYPTRLTATNVATILMQAVADGKSSRGYRSLVSIVATLFCPVG